MFCKTTQAQNSQFEKYIWQNENKKINASIEIYGSESIKSKSCLYLITGVDTTLNAQSKDITSKFVEGSAPDYKMVKITFYAPCDSTTNLLFSRELENFILPDVQKRYNIDSSNIIFAGVNDYACVALHTSLQKRNKSNKTILFFNNYQPDDFVCQALENATRGLTGKIFMYVNSDEQSVSATNSLAESMALNSSVLLYKYDEGNTGVTTNILREACNWLLADGSNYILKKED